MFQKQIAAEYGDEVTVTVYDESEPPAVYLDISEESHPAIRFVRLTAPQAKQLRKALKGALKEMES
jgi:hypothetical protein